MKRFTTLLLAAVAALATPAFAAQLESGTTFTLPPEETVTGDLYFGGNTARLDGTVDGSVLAGAKNVTITGKVLHNLFVGAQTVDISGPVGGDILAFCASLDITDTVIGSVRAGAGKIHIDSKICQDALAGCRNLTIGKDGDISGDLICGCGELNINGTVHGDVHASADKIIISGIIDGDLIATVGEQLVLTQDARIFGNLRYKSTKELNLGNPDAVFGNIQFTKRARPKKTVELKKLKPGFFTAFFLPFAILSVLGALAIGFILIAVWKNPLNRAAEQTFSRFGRTVGFGALGLFAAPAALIISYLLVITIPAGLVGLLLFLIFLYLSKILAGMFLGKWLFGIFGGKTASIWLFSPIGIILIYALCAIPFAGWPIRLFAAILGFGIIIQALASTRRSQ